MPPHIVIFNPDQWRGDVLGHMDDPAAVTPNLDRMVQTDAVSFRAAYAQNPVCTPSRCSFMSGWYPHTRGHRTMFHMLQPDEPMLLRTLKQNGYFVWWGGKNDVVPAQNGYDDYCDIKYRIPPEKLTFENLHGWNEWRGEPGYYSMYYGKIETDAAHAGDSDWGYVEGAVEFIHNAPKDRPLCIYLPLGNPHPPYAVEDPWFSLIDRDNLPNRTPTPEDWRGKPAMLKGIHDTLDMDGWTEEQWRELRATYYGMVARIDHQFGLVVDALKTAGIYDDTAIFVFSDHGDFTGDYGLVEKTQCTFEDCLTRVPFVVKPPKDVPVQPGVREALVELVDFPATVEALTGIKPGHTHFGRSLLPVIAGATDRHRDAVFCMGGFLENEPHVREANYDATSLYYPRQRLQYAPGNANGKAIMCRTREYKYVYRLYESDEFYDLRSDPEELHNLIDDVAANPELADELAHLRARLMRFLVETSDVVPFTPDAR